MLDGCLLRCSVVALRCVVGLARLTVPVVAPLCLTPQHSAPPSVMSGLEQKQEWGIVSLHQAPGEEGSVTGASSQRSPKGTPNGGGASNRGKSASIEMMSPSARSSQPERQPSPGAAAQQRRERDEHGPEDPLSEAEEEQIKMEAQVSMLLTAARSGHKHAQQPRSAHSDTVTRQSAPRNWGDCGGCAIRFSG